MPKFKVGDLVYYPSYSTKVFQLIDGVGNYPLVINDKEENIVQSFTLEGYPYLSHKIPHIFHATKANRQTLELLYQEKFEEPMNFLQYHLSLGSKVLCIVSHNPIQKVNKVWKIKSKVTLVNNYNKVSNKYVCDMTNVNYQYALPIAIDSLGNITYLG